MQTVQPRADARAEVTGASAAVTIRLPNTSTRSFKSAAANENRAWTNQFLLSPPPAMKPTAASA
jgi:hypothetical protein